MFIIIAPTKTMKQDGRSIPQSLPVLWERSAVLLQTVKELPLSKIMELMKIKEPLARQNQERFNNLVFDLQGNCAIEAYDGLQFKQIQVETMSPAEILYLQEHLRILSGFYGVVRPLDSVYPYRLEMQSRLAVGETKDLYSFWKDQLAKSLEEEIEKQGDPYLLNLASKEYEKAVRPYLRKAQWIDVIFQIEKEGKRKVESTQVKMARGKMIRYLAKQQILTLEEVKRFCEDGYRLDEEQTEEQRLVFYKKG